ncbi:hypothetical protein D3C85_750340 [compost metagenome]
MASNTYSDTSAGRLKSIGKLLSDPEFWLGNSGSVILRVSSVIVAATPMAMNVVRQPSASPNTRPSGMPRTMARVVPVASRLKALTCLPGGATRTAREAVIDQNTAWATAIPARLASNMPKLVAIALTTWLAMNSVKRMTSNLRRSILRVSNIIGRDNNVTIQA